MRQQDVVDALQRVEREIADAGAGVDQHVRVEQEARRAAVARDRPGAAEDLDFHAGITPEGGRGSVNGEGLVLGPPRLPARPADGPPAPATPARPAGRRAARSVARERWHARPALPQ